jgi:hypothetical protein
VISEDLPARYYSANEGMGDTAGLTNLSNSKITIDFADSGLHQGKLNDYGVDAEDKVEYYFNRFKESRLGNIGESPVLEKTKINQRS